MCFLFFLSNTLFIEGLISTKDDKLVYGIRAGNSHAGKVDNVPTGHLSFNEEWQNPFLEGFYEGLCLCKNNLL